jgi:hypothetical protein
MRQMPGADAKAPGPQAGVPIARALRLFADDANFPVLVHCVIGKDRTGLVMMLLLLLCGVAEADVINDYVASEALLHAARAKGELRSLHGARPPRPRRAPPLRRAARLTAALSPGRTPGGGLPGR